MSFGDMESDFDSKMLDQMVPIFEEYLAYEGNEYNAPGYILVIDKFYELFCKRTSYFHNSYIPDGIRSVVWEAFNRVSKDEYIYNVPGYIPYRAKNVEKKQVIAVDYLIAFDKENE